MKDLNQLLQINLCETPESWERIGFNVDFDSTGASISVGNTKLWFAHNSQTSGINSVCVNGISGNLDSLKFEPAEKTGPKPPCPPHPNHVERIDHLVVTSPDCDRTTVILEEAGLNLEGVRKFGNTPNRMRQSFFWLGDVILELVGPDNPTTEGRPSFWGLALVSSDIDETVRKMGTLCSPVKDAVQPGRKITTVETRQLPIGTSIAIMSPHVRKK